MGKRKLNTSASHYRQKKTTVEADGTITTSDRTLSAPAVVHDKAQRVVQSRARRKGELWLMFNVQCEPTYHVWLRRNVRI